MSARRSCAVFWFLSAALSQAFAAVAPTFAIEVAPILNAHCAACHHPQGDGPFSLLTYEEAKKRSRQIAEVVASRFMPPWKPTRDHGPALQGERGLSAEQLATLGRWHEAGAPAGDLAVAPPPPEFSDGWKLGPPDLVLELPEAFTLPAEGKDVFRNFVIRVPLNAPRFVRAVEFSPQTRRIVHHASIALDPTDASRRRDAADPGPGWATMDLGDTINPGGHIIGWTPGQVPYEAYPGTAWELKPGTDFVVQLHLLPTGKPERIAPRLGIYFTDAPPTRGASIIQLRRQKIDIAPGDAAYRVEESIVLPVAASVLRLFPHAHYLGKDIHIFAELPGGKRQELLHIPDWDFNWQSDYCFKEPVRLPAGARLVMAYTYDNSAANPRNPSSPPRRVKWGWGSTDEMGGVVIQLLLENFTDWAPMQEVQARYELGVFGDNAFTLTGLGRAVDFQGRAEEAAGIFARAIVLNPAATEAGIALAKIQFARGHAADASRTLEPVLRQEPSNRLARQNLALMRAQLGDRSGAAALLAEGLRWHQASAAYRLQLGRALLQADAAVAAREHLWAAASLDEPEATPALRADALQTLALVGMELRDWPAAKDALRRALAIQPEHVEARLMSAGFALVDGDATAARAHLGVVIGLPETSRPTEAAILDALPAPAGIIALAEALAEANRRDEGRALLVKAIQSRVPTFDPRETEMLRRALRGLEAR